ncbi:RidA family protein [Pedobacter sp.]|jgi:2-iminobutanoate/2-iminopropanoate deaminase|uniref:RidA family protein n=1 Tax=Pedobacter sp. TaxID=1411316 RepID=UPI002BC013E5|nr:RidA family protein [Pedobacter sp.]HWW42175.1 RidA family protein [Pedobacter sp.]
MKPIYRAIILILASVNAIAADAQTTKQTSNKNNMVKHHEISQFGYSEYVEIDLGTAKMLVFSGQLALDNDGNTVGAGNFEQQAEYIFSSIQKKLEKAGGSLKNIIKLNNYFTDISNLPAFRTIRNKYIDTTQPPAQTSVEVKQLFRADVMLEVEFMAVINY